MRVAVIEPAGKGGMIHYAWQLCDAMAGAGADVTLVTDQSYELDALPHRFQVEKLLHLWDPKPDESIPSGKLKRAVRGAGYYAQWGRLVRYLRRVRPDVAHFGDIRFATDLVPLSGLRGSGIVLGDICHNVRPFALGGSAAGSFDAGRLVAAGYRRIYRLFDVVFVHFERNRAEFVERFPSARRTETIVHGNEAIFRLLADPDVTAATVRARLGIASDAPVVLFFGTLSRYKRLDLLVESFGEVVREIPDAQLIIAGFPVGGFDPQRLAVQAREAGIETNVRVLSRYIASSEVQAWMEMAAVVVFPYDVVYQSGALHVPLTFGRPVVATAVGAMCDVVRDGVTGVLVRPGDREALSEAMIRALRDPESSARMGSIAAADQETLFSWRRNAEVILETYDGILRGRR
jgi:glycosyltransferase involved in cell wall biosynthesis